MLHTENRKRTKYSPLVSHGFFLGIAHDNGLQDQWMWIGLNNLNASNTATFAWIDGSGVDYTNWVSGESPTLSSAG